MEEFIDRYRPIREFQEFVETSPVRAFFFFFFLLFFSLLLSSIGLSGTKVYEPSIRAVLDTASRFCEPLFFFFVTLKPRAK